MGRYVWRKSEIIQPQIVVTNPKLTMYRDYASSTTDYYYKYTFVCNDVDFNAFENLQKIYAFLDGFEGTSYSNVFTFQYTSIYSRLDWVYNHSSTLQNFAYSSNPFTANGNTLELYSDNSFSGITSIQMSYTGTKIISDIITKPIGFVVGMSEDLFPISGEKPGYWYELIGSIESTQALSLSTLSADTMRDIAIEEVQQEVITNAD